MVIVLSKQTIPHESIISICESAVNHKNEVHILLADRESGFTAINTRKNPTRKNLENTPLIFFV